MFIIQRGSWALNILTIGVFLVDVNLTGVEADCEISKIRNRSGIITSPHGLTGPYCVYIQFKVDGANSITVSFDYLYLGPSSVCENSYLAIGPMNKRKICGNFTVPYIAPIRDHGRAWMYYQTDDVATNKFKLHFIVNTVPEQECPPGEWMCRNGKCILEEWRCNNKYECVDHTDEEQCHLESSTITPSCGRYEFRCGNHRCIHELKLCDRFNDCGDFSDEFSCPDKTTTRTWEPIVTDSACRPGGIQLGERYGIIMSPNFPSHYPDNMDCSWTISNVRHNVIQLRFTFFRLQNKRATDYISVYDGSSEESPLIGTYFGTSPPQNLIQSTYHQLHVVFHSDTSYTESGFNATYQQKGECMLDQLSCEQESECYLHSERCNGYWNCPEHGSDEFGCHGCPDKFSCGQGLKCYTETERCNGKSMCLNNADELNCTSKRCGSQNGLFLCRNQRCIYESWECDRTSDCDDHSDEDGCPSPFFTRRVVVAAVAGSLICSLLLVIALGCICKVYALRMHEQCGPRHESPLSRLQAEFFRRRAPPPPYHEAMLTSRPYEEARREYLNQSREHRRRRASDRRRNRTLPPTPEEPTMHQIASDSADLEQGGGNDVQLLSLNSTNEQNAMHVTDSTSTTHLIPPTTSSDSDGNQESDDEETCGDDGGVEEDNDSVLLDLSDGIGGTVTWRSRLTSDEGQSPEHAPSDVGCDSLDSASATLSVDDMSLALEETLDKENGVQAQIVDKNSSVDPTTSQESVSSTVTTESCSTVDSQIKTQ